MMTGQQLSRFDIAELVSEPPKVFLGQDFYLFWSYSKIL